MLLSVLIPVYNERAVVERCLAQVLSAPLPENMERELMSRFHRGSSCRKRGASCIWDPFLNSPFFPLYSNRHELCQ